jgi:mannose-6-phosphate isomerase-like protein (cupin superfamily)
MSDYTILNLDDVEDRAPGFGITFGEVRFPRTDLGATETGFGVQRIFAGERQSFGHRHQQAEEIYLVLSGSGAVKLDDEVRDLRAHDIVRVAPAVMRCFQAGPEGMEILAFGAHHERDGETVADFWQD